MQIETSINHRKVKMVWQRRFWEHYIRNEEDWRMHMDYIHYNPVNHGFVRTVQDWQHSSFHYCVEKGLYKLNWGSELPMALIKLKNLE
jgi:putative transposase